MTENFCKNRSLKGARSQRFKIFFFSPAERNSQTLTEKTRPKNLVGLLEPGLFRFHLLPFPILLFMFPEQTAYRKWPRRHRIQFCPSAYLSSFQLHKSESENWNIRNQCNLMQPLVWSKTSYLFFFWLFPKSSVNLSD